MILFVVYLNLEKQNLNQKLFNCLNYTKAI